MKKLNLKNRAVSGLLVMSMVASLLTALVIAVTATPPVVHIDGMELRMVAEYYTDANGQYCHNDEDNTPLSEGESPIPIMKDGQQAQSIQALVSVSISGGERNTGIYLPMWYNDSYLVPSDWKTNGEITMVDNKGNYADADDPLHHLFFHVDNDLYRAEDEEKGTDPFAWGSNAGGYETYVNIMNVSGTSKVISLMLSVKRNLAAKGKIGEMHYSSKLTTFDDNFIKIEDDGKTTLGTLSFRVNDSGSESFEQLQEKLQTFAEKFNDGEQGKSVDGLETLFKIFTKDDPATTGSTDTDKLYIHYIAYTNGVPRGRAANKDSVTYNIHVDSDDVIIKAEPVKKDVTINSYQAYTDGRPGDLALAMQKYAESVRTTYVSGKLADQAIYWGENPTDCTNKPDDGPGMFIQKGTITTVDGEKTFAPSDEDDTVYRFRWLSDGSYVIHKQDDDGNYTVDVTSTFAYDPRGGQYKISQYFTYFEKAGVPEEGEAEVDPDSIVRKAYPIPVEVLLTVTPINLTGAFMDNLSITYKNTAITDEEPDGAPTLFAGLDLADEAKLTLDTMLNGVVPTMPVTWKPNKLTKTEGDVTTGITGEPGSGYLGDTAIWPFTNADYVAKTGIGDYTFSTAKITETAVRAKYPWLTTDDAPWSTETVDETTVNYFDFSAHRYIVDVDDASELASLYHMEVEPYESPLGDTVGNLRVTIWKGTVNESGGKVYQDMDAGYKFRLYMPNGNEIMVDPAFNNGSGQWFGGAYATTGDDNSFYRVSRSGSDGAHYYQIQISPGDLNGSGSFADQREVLRRYINLGGWFSADVLPPASGADWVSRISAYSRPRTNVYIKSYTAITNSEVTDSRAMLFDYTGNRAGLRPFYKTSTLLPFITLLADESVATRYDYFDGSQPGSMRQFLVESTTNTWPSVRSYIGETFDSTTPVWHVADPDVENDVNAVVFYGDDLFARNHDYSNFGRMINPETAGYTGYPADSAVVDRKALLKVEVQDGDAPTTPDGYPNVLLTYELSGDSITYTTYPNAPLVDQVKRVTFEPKAEGYTWQQVVTLTLTNNGTTEIQGIHIDVPLVDDGQTIPYFTILSAPAVNLPAGASTTFDISYIPNLSVGTYQNIFPTGSLPIDILDGNETVLRQFEAVIKITEGKVHRVDLVVHPGEEEDVERLMGDAQLVAGISHEDTADAYDGTLAPNTYITGDIFWVLTLPEDEYDITWKYAEDGITKIPQVYFEEDYINEDGNPDTRRVYLHEYPTEKPDGFDGTADDYVGEAGNRRLFWIEMPDQSITVHVRYYEPLTSKLRLTDLLAFSWDDKGDLSGTAWARETTETTPKRPIIPYADPDDTSDATDFWDRDITDTRYNRQLYATQEDNYEKVIYDQDRDEYIVVLKELNNADTSLNGDEWCGVWVKLRELKVRVTGVEGMPEYKNQEISPYVYMQLRDSSHTLVGGIPQWGYTNTPDSESIKASDHHSAVFIGPTEESVDEHHVAVQTVDIMVYYNGTADGEPVLPDAEDPGYEDAVARKAAWDAQGQPLVPPEEASRTYTVHFVRKVSSEARHTANAGNSPYGMIENDSTIADKAAAKAKFNEANRFAAPYIPVKASGLTNIYWPEAWGATGAGTKYNDNGKTNYDRDETALFVYLGQPFYDPGVTGVYNNAADLIRDVDVQRTIESVYLMKTGSTAKSALTRFNNGTVADTATTVVDLGTIHVQDTDAGAGVIPGAAYTISTTTINDDETETTVNVEYSGTIETLVSQSTIRPGVYRLKYTFLDYSGIEAEMAEKKKIEEERAEGATITDAEAEARIDTATAGKTISFTRPLIVLSPNGDVNADLKLNSIDVKDPDAIWGRFGENLPHMKLLDAVYSAQDKLLYRYRIVDANNDRNINDVDADQIRNATTSGFDTHRAASGDTDYGRLTEFYRPTDYINP